MNEFYDRLFFYKTHEIFFDFVSDLFHYEGESCFLPYVHWKVDGEWQQEDCGHYEDFQDAIVAAFNYADKILRKRNGIMTKEEKEMEEIYEIIAKRTEYYIKNIEEIGGLDIELFQVARKNLLENDYEELGIEEGANFLSINHKEKSFRGFFNKKPVDWFKNYLKIVDFYLDCE